jgi:5-formyltetrahydrofolate cyclo-ligase
VTDVDSPKEPPPPTGPERTKAEWRAQLLAARRAMSEAERATAAHRVARHVLTAPVLQGARRLAAYVPIRGEPGSLELLDALRSRDVQVLLPVTAAGCTLDWAPYGGPLVPAGYGLLEPATRRLGPGAIAGVDLVLAPGLAVDRRGIRLGRGKGYYDRALRGLDGIPVVVLLHDGELVEEDLPAEPHDRPVSAVVTPVLGWVDVG